MLLRKKRWIAVAIALAVVVLMAVYTVADPTASYMPRCVFRTLTGWNCPGCGSQRFLHALMTGQPLKAVSYNYFLPVGVVMIALACWLEATSHTHPKRYRRWMRPRNLYFVMGLICLWWILRNLLGV